jgi:predicted lipoprotein with Yx(FWY)xxD motif
MKRTLLTITTLLALAVAAPAAWADDLPKPLKHRKAGDLGMVLTGPRDMTLYTYANDTEPNKSTCTDACAANWPPFKPEANAPAPTAPLTVLRRIDGSMQYAWKGKPLYYWKNDKKPGDTGGHKFRDVWFAAQP